VVRARNALEWRSLRANWTATPTATREFRRGDRLLIRLEVYTPGNATPTVSARLLNRGGDPMTDLPVEPGGSSPVRQVDLQLASLPPGDYLLEVAATIDGQQARELVAFRLTS
jgi:hypothetical protein